MTSIPHVGYVGNFPLSEQRSVMANAAENSLLGNDAPHGKPKTLSLGFNRAFDGGAALNPQRKDPTKNREFAKQEKFRQFLQQDLEERERRRKDEKIKERMHPFELSPERASIKKPVQDAQVYEGLNIGEQADIDREERRRRAAETNKKLAGNSFLLIFYQSSSV